MESLRALVLVREGQYHDLVGNTRTLAGFLREALGADLTVTGDLSLLASGELDRFDLVINNTFALVPEPLELAGLLRFVADGKGFLGIHTASCTFDGPEYRSLLGGRFVTHPPYGPFTVRFQDPGHPLVRGLEPFTVEDELYVCEHDPGIEVLASAAWEEGQTPLAWVKPYGKGRVCYVALGHDASAYSHPGFRELIIRGALWSGGRMPTRWFPSALLPRAPKPAGRLEYRVGVVGTGGIANLHAQAYQKVGRTRIVACSDLRPEAAEAFAARYECPSHCTDPVAMAREEGTEVVSVCTWPDSHCEIVVSLAETGVVRGILCEKPMALTMGEADRMLEACEAHGVKLAVNHQRRFAAHHQKVKDLVSSGALGALERVWGSVTTFYVDPFVWATHVTDMMRFYAGDVEWLMGQIGEIAQKPARQGGHRYSPTGVGYLQFRGGARGVFDFERDRGEILILGTRGQVLVKMDPPKEGPTLLVSTLESPQWTTPPYEGFGGEAWPGFVPAVEDLLEAVEEDKDPLNSGREGAAALEVLLAVFESARSRGRVSFPLRMRDYPLDPHLAAPLPFD